MSVIDDDPVERFYGNKPEEDYKRIVALIKSGEELSRADFLERLQIPEDVLDVFFDEVFVKCDASERDDLCDRLIGINKDVLDKIIKRLKKENFSFRSEKEQWEDKLVTLTSEIAAKDQQIEDLKNNNGAGLSDSNKDEYILLLEAERDELRVQIVQLEAQIEELQASVQSSNERYHTTLAEKDQRIAELEIDGNNTVKDAEKDFDISPLQEENARLCGLVEEYETKIEDNNQLIAELQANNSTNNEDYIAALEAERDELRVRVEELTHALSENDGSDFQEKIDMLEAEGAYKDSLINDLNEKIATFEYEIENSKATTINKVSNYDDQELNNKVDDDEFDFVTTEKDTPVKKKSSTALLVVIGFIFTILLGLIAVVIINNNSAGPVPGIPTEIPKNQMPMGGDLNNQVVQGLATQVPSITTNQAPSADVQGAVPTTLTQAPVQQPVDSLLTTLTTAEAFRKAAGQFKINDQGALVINNQTFGMGEQINGFKIIAIHRTFIRLIDVKNDLQFRVDLMGAQ